MIFEQFIGNIPEFVIDAFKDSAKLLPFLFIIFLFIELFENYFSQKIVSILRFSQKIGPVAGAVFAIVPQCGFSVIASVLYVKNFISTGTLVAVYIATSDEAIPILLSEPSMFLTVCKIIIIKLILAVISGYFIDFFFKTKQISFSDKMDFNLEKGCCNHSIYENKIFSVIFHPIKHTLIIFLFIFAVCTGLNYMFDVLSEQKIETIMMQNSIFQPILAGIFGLIPNCAVSVFITMMYLKGVISFGSVIAGLSSGAGLGLLILLRKNPDFKNSLFIIFILTIFSIFAGILFQIFE